jgi:hypothetical protein
MSNKYADVMQLATFPVKLTKKQEKQIKILDKLQKDKPKNPSPLKQNSKTIKESKIANLKQQQKSQEEFSLDSFISSDAKIVIEKNDGDDDDDDATIDIARIEQRRKLEKEKQTNLTEISLKSNENPTLSLSGASKSLNQHNVSAAIVEDEIIQKHSLENFISEDSMNLENVAKTNLINEKRKELFDDVSSFSTKRTHIYRNAFIQQSNGKLSLNCEQYGFLLEEELLKCFYRENSDAQTHINSYNDFVLNKIPIIFEKNGKFFFLFYEKNTI